MSNDPYHPEAMRLELQNVLSQIASIEARTLPLRKQRDGFVNACRDKELVLNENLLQAEQGLADLKRKYAVLVKAVGPFKAMEAKPATLGTEPQELI